MCQASMKIALRKKARLIELLTRRPNDCVTAGLGSKGPYFLAATTTAIPLTIPRALP